MTGDVRLPPFPSRPDDAHKGQVGRVMIVGGRLDDVGMVGAPALAANAAFRCGAGLVQVVTPREAQSAVHTLAPCATTRVLDEGGGERLSQWADEFRADVVAIGPGMSPQVTGDHILRLIRDFRGPVVVDADGLNALAHVGAWRTPDDADVVLTPHTGEMRRLLDGLSIHIDPRQQREAAAKELATATHTVVVHKGAGSVVSDGRNAYVNDSGHSGMATGGAGDVLTGMIAALLGQRMTTYEAAVLGVWLHGRAGECAAERLGTVSMTAVDMFDGMAEAIRRYRSQS